jgi:hypothetical protein
MVQSSLARLVQAASQLATDVARGAASNPRARKAVVELTDAAASRIRELLAQRHKVRLGTQSLLDSFNVPVRPDRARVVPIHPLTPSWVLAAAGVHKIGCKKAWLQRPKLHAELFR